LGRRAVQRVRREEKLHALDISCRCASTLIHITAGYPSCAGRHSDLVAAAVITNRRAGGMAAMEEIIARFLRIVAAGIADAVVNGIVPVKIVIRGDSVPTTVMRLERVMRPANTGVCARHDHSLSSKAQRPHIRRMRVNDARLDRRRIARS
jgi:hypothetical protein